MISLIALITGYERFLSTDVTVLHVNDQTCHGCIALFLIKALSVKRYLLTAVEVYRVHILLAAQALSALIQRRAFWHN